MSNDRKRASRGDDSDSSLSSLEDSPPAKQKKLHEVQRAKSANGDEIIDLTGKKHVCVRSFHGRVFVDIREYYEDKNDGGLRPGKKGISLNVEQWEKLKSAIEVIDSEIKS